MPDSPTPDLVRAVRAGCSRQFPDCAFPSESCNRYCAGFVEQIRAALAALLASPPPAVERAVLERLLTELAEMRQRYRGNPYLAERVQWAADWLRDKRAELAQGESDG